MVEMNGKATESPECVDQAECPFLCKEVKGRLLEHFDEIHSKDLAYVCSKCNGTITGGLKQFVLHQIKYHPRISAPYLMASVVHSDRSDKSDHQEPRIPNFRGICPYCKIPVHLFTEDAFNLHLESLHDDMIQSSVRSIIHLVKFSTIEQVFESAKDNVSYLLPKIDKNIEENQQKPLQEDLTAAPIIEKPQIVKNLPESSSTGKPQVIKDVESKKSKAKSEYG